MNFHYWTEMQVLLHHTLVGVEFKERLEHQRDALSAAQQRVVEVLLGDRAEAAFMGADEVAQRAGVSVATTVRLAQRLGYEGYPALRGSLQEEFRTHRSLGERLRDVPSTTGILPTLVAGEQAALGAAVTSVTDEELIAAARVIRGAERVFVHARGHATVVGELLVRRLRRLGRTVIALFGEGREIAEQLHTIDAGDVVISLALRRQPPLYAAVMRYATAQGATTVVIGDAAGSLLQPRPDHLLAASRGPHDGYLTIVVPTLIAEALAVAVGRLDPEAPATLDRLEQLIDELGP